MALDHTKVAEVLEGDFLAVLRQSKNAAFDSLFEFIYQSAKALTSDAPAHEQIRANTQLLQFVETTSRSMAFADLLGRLRLVRELRAQGAEIHRCRFCGSQYEAINEELPDFLKLPMNEAIVDFINREPVLARSADKVEKAYRAHQFSIARATKLQVVQAVQRKLTRVIADGGTFEDFKKFMLKQDGVREMTDGYIQTVFRTNLSTAAHAGRLDMASDPDVDEYLVAWEYVAMVSDPNKPRPNHAAMHGHVAEKHAHVWSIWFPPNGFNCRCIVLEMSRDEATRRRRFDRNGQFKNDPAPTVLPDPGFRQGPKGAIYGS